MGSACAVQPALLIEQRSRRDSDAELHRRLDAVPLHIKAGACELAVVLLRSNHEYRGPGHQEAAVAGGVSEDWGGRVNGVFGFSALVADLDDVALRRLGNRADRGIGRRTASSRRCDSAQGNTNWGG